jgi:hypothetical protein
VAKNIAADQHIPMAFFSLEMTDVQLANRLMSNACMIEGQKLLSGQMDREDWKRLENVPVLALRQLNRGHDIIFIARLVKIWKYSKHFVILYPK